MPAARPLAERFWEKVDKNGPVIRAELGPCWLWTAAEFVSGGYGAISYLLRPMRASRVSWFLAYGRWPDNEVLHRCDNPPCVNPSHLSEGTHADNMKDAMVKKRIVRLDNGTFARGATA